MRPEVWRWARWLIALGACGLIVVVGVPMAIDAVTSIVVVGGEEGQDDAEAAESEDTTDDEGDPDDVPTGPVTDGQAEPEADFTVADGTVRQASSAELSLSDEGDAVVLRFPLIPGSPDCVASAELELGLLEADRTEIAVYAGGVVSDVEDGDELDDARRDDTVHGLALTDGSAGRLRWDVTDLYRAWAGGDLATPGTPLVVVVSVPEGEAEVTFASSESDAEDDPPALVWEGEPGCGESDDG